MRIRSTHRQIFREHFPASLLIALIVRRTIFKYLVCLLIALLGTVSASAQQAASELNGSLTVTVMDQDHRYASGIGKDRFSLFDKKTPLEITAFSNEDTPLSIAVLLDLSGSQSGTTLDTANWVAQFIGRGNSANEYLIVGFNKGSGILCDWGCREKELLAALNVASRAEPKNGTALYQAIDRALKEMARSSRARRVIVLLSDGLDNLSTITFEQLRRSLKESDVMVYSVGVLSADISRSMIGMEGQDVLEELARVTGGEAFFPQSRNELTDIAEHLALELRHQYVFGFKVVTPPNHDPHKIKVKVTPSVIKQGSKTIHLQWRYKEAFYRH